MIQRLLAAAFLTVCVAVVYIWFATAGAWDLAEPHETGRYFDSLARSIAGGTMQVPRDDIGGEAFIVNGRVYGYFGPTPALARMILNPLFPAMEYRWSRVSMVMAGLVTLAALGFLLHTIGLPAGGFWWCFYLIVSAFGSVLLFAPAWPAVYMEAIAWGAGFAICSYSMMLAWLRGLRERRRDSLLLLAAACLFAVLGFFARVSSGSSALAGLMIAVWFAGARRPRAIATATLLATAAVYAGMNWVRFGTLLNGLPVQFHVQYSKERLAVINGKVSHPERIPVILGEYLLAAPVFRSSFPWLEFGQTVLNLGAMDGIETHAGVPATMPLLSLLAVIGVAFGTRADPVARAVVLSALAGVAVLCSVVFISQRYLLDFLPFLTVGGAHGLAWLVNTFRGRAARLAPLLLLAGWSVFCNVGLAMVFQREVVWGVNLEARYRFQSFRIAVDRALGSPAPPLEFDPGGERPAPRARGFEIIVKPTGATYRFDGDLWQPRDGAAPLHRFDVTLRLDTTPAASQLAVLYAGRTGNSDTVWLSWESGAGYRFCFDHWGTRPVCGAVVLLQPRRQYRVRLDLDRLNNNVEIQVDGKTAFSHPTQLHPWREDSVRLGNNPLGGTYGEKFPGLIEPVR